MRLGGSRRWLPRCLNNYSGTFTNIPFLSPTDLIGPSRVPLPPSNTDGEKRWNGRGNGTGEGGGVAEEIRQRKGVE